MVYAITMLVLFYSAIPLGEGLAQIEHMHCYSYNFEELECGWDLKTSVPVSIKASILVPKPDGTARLKCVTTISSNQRQCKLQDDSLLQYPTMTLLLEAYADGQLMDNKTHFMNLTQIAVPGENDEVSTLTTTTSFELTIIPNKRLRHSSVPNLAYHIEVEDASTQQKKAVHDTEVKWMADESKWTGNVWMIDGLEQGTRYNVTFKNRFVTAYKHNPNLWHTEFTYVKTHPVFLLPKVKDEGKKTIPCGNMTCGILEYCRTFDHTCLPCSEICDKSSDEYTPTKCSRDCQNYSDSISPDSFPEIENIHCYSYNFEELVCTWDLNQILPVFIKALVLVPKHNQIVILECTTLATSNQRQCKFQDASLLQHPTITLLLEMYADRQLIRNTLHFIDQTRIAVPGKNDKVYTKTGPESLEVTIDPNKGLRHESLPNLEYQIEYEDSRDNAKKGVRRMEVKWDSDQRKWTGNVANITGLEKETRYVVTFNNRFVTADKNDSNLWNTEVLFVKTQPHFLRPEAEDELKKVESCEDVECGVFKYCSAFNHTCLPCSEICDKSSDTYTPTKCANLCLNYLRKDVVSITQDLFAVRGTKSVTLHWNPNRQFRLQKPIDLVYEIQYVNPWTNQSKLKSNISVAYTDDGKWTGNSATFEGLEEDTDYTFVIRGRMRTEDEENPRSWETDFGTVRTLAAVPDSPEVSAGLFKSQKITKGELRNVVVYWKDLLPIQWNGPPEHIYGVHLEGDYWLDTKATKMNYMNMKGEEELKFKLVAHNEEGSSNETIITVPAASRLLEPPKIKKEYIGHETFRISWEPSDSSDVTSYTVAWCKDPDNTAADCDGSFEWKEVTGSSVSVDIYREDLNFPSDRCSDVPFAVAVNSATSSSGLIGIKEIEIIGVSGTRSMTLHWNPNKCYRLRAPIDLVYQILYVDPWTKQSRLRKNIFVTYTNDGKWTGNSTTVTDLEEYTSYNFIIRGRLKTADDRNLQSWTTQSKTFRTLPSVPESPEVPPGLFRSHKMAGGTRDVVLYWKNLLPIQWNGPPEHLYRLQRDYKTGMLTKDTHMEYMDVEAEEDLVFNLQAKNGKGTSKKTTITIPATSKLLEAPKARKKYLRNGIFRISLEPSEMKNITSYTIVWCKDPNNTSNKCNNSFEWIVVEGSYISVDIYREDFNLPNVNVVNVPFSIAVNTASSSSGLIGVDN